MRSSSRAPAASDRRPDELAAQQQHAHGEDRRQAAVHGVLMFPLAAAFGWLITRGSRAAADQAASAPVR